MDKGVGFGSGMKFKGRRDGLCIVYEVLKSLAKQGIRVCWLAVVLTSDGERTDFRYASDV